ncbi:hypothetical protein ACRYI5_00945 [Furfurilactobacillus sp. WILCCON 0119]
MMQTQQVNRFSRLLNHTMERLSLNQKAVGLSSGVNKSSVSNAAKGVQVSTENMVKMANGINDYEATLSVAYELLRVLPLFNGSAFRHEALAVDAFSEQEERERQEAYVTDQVRTLLATGHLDHKQREQLHHYVGEEMDSLLMLLTDFVYACRLLDVNPSDLYDERKGEYLKKGYIKEV